jgi:chromosome partitioning protein
VKIIGFVNLKGGAGKTTTAVGVAHGMKRRGIRVGVVDCDPNGSASRWLSEQAEIDNVPCRADQLKTFLPTLINDYDLVIIDSPPNDQPAIAAIAEVSHLALIPLAPSTIEVDQLPDTVAILRQIGTPWTVVPVRVRMSTTAGQSIRQLCRDLDVKVTESMVPLQEAVSRSFGDTPPPLPFGPLVNELVNELGLALVVTA